MDGFRKQTNMKNRTSSTKSRYIGQLRCWLQSLTFLVLKLGLINGDTLTPEMMQFLKDFPMGGHQMMKTLDQVVEETYFPRRNLAICKSPLWLL